MLLVAALMVRMLVPAGYMPGMANDAFVMQPCDGWTATQTPRHAAMTAGDHGNAGHDKDHSGRSKHHNLQATCAFSFLGAASLAGIEDFLVAIAIVLVVAALFRAEWLPVLKRSNWLRPPPQGPPFAG